MLSYPVSEQRLSPDRVSHNKQCFPQRQFNPLSEHIDNASARAHLLRREELSASPNLDNAKYRLAHVSKTSDAIDTASQEDGSHIKPSYPYKVLPMRLSTKTMSEVATVFLLDTSTTAQTSLMICSRHQYTSRHAIFRWRLHLFKLCS